MNMAYAGGASGGVAAAAAAAAMAQAIKASGAIVKVEPKDFLSILSRTQKPLVVVAKGGFIKAHFRYLFGYRDLVFFTKSPTPLLLSGDIDLISAKKIWIPN